MPVSNVSSTQKALLASCHYAKLKYAKAAQPTIGFSALDHLICDNHLFIEGLHPLLDNMRIFYKSVLLLTPTFSRRIHDMASIEKGFVKSGTQILSSMDRLPHESNEKQPPRWRMMWRPWRVQGSRLTGSTVSLGGSSRIINGLLKMSIQ